ncbi:DNA methyltransferase, partial [Campylobacter sp.]
MYQENSYTDLFENVISDSKAKRNMKERKYDARNKLNDLTGAEWQFSTRTVISKIYPSNLQHKLRSQHGGQKPPELCADLIKIFTKKGQTILDPLAGVGGSLLGAALCGREAIGIELNNKWIDIYKEVCKLEKLKEFKILVGDANERLREIKENSIDFVITDVPYWIMDKLKQTRSKNANRESKLTNFNDKELQTKQEWLSEMKDIFAKILPVLKNNGYMAVFIGDLYREKEYHFLSAELAQAISQIYGFILKSDIIWH